MLFNLIKLDIKDKFNYNMQFMNKYNWGLGIGDWGLGIGDWEIGRAHV